MHFAPDARAEPFVHVHTFAGVEGHNDGTGGAVALTETRALIATPSAPGSRPQTIATLYEFDPLAPNAEIKAPHGRYSGGQFGNKVALHGDLALICGAAAPQKPPEENLAYLYDAKTGARLFRFRDPSVENGSKFGAKCALNDRHALISAPAFRGRGAGFLYDVETGALLRTFNSPISGAHSGFGTNIALSRRYAAFTKSSRTGEIGGPGATYVFDVETGELVRRFYQREEDRGLVGGVAIADGRLLIGHTYGWLGGRRTGWADIFDIETGAFIRRFTPPGSAANAFFGDKMVWSGGRILFAAADFRLSRRSPEGAAFLFDAATGELLEIFQRPPAATETDFPAGIAMAGKWVLLGTLDDDPFESASVYLFEETAPASAGDEDDE